MTRHDKSVFNVARRIDMDKDKAAIREMVYDTTIRLAFETHAVTGMSKQLSWMPGRGFFVVKTSWDGESHFYEADGVDEWDVLENAMDRYFSIHL